MDRLAEAIQLYEKSVRSYQLFDRRHRIPSETPIIKVIWALLKSVLFVLRQQKPASRREDKPVVKRLVY